MPLNRSKNFATPETEGLSHVHRDEAVFTFCKSPQTRPSLIALTSLNVNCEIVSKSSLH